MPTQSRDLTTSPEAAAEASAMLLEAADEWSIPEHIVERILLAVGEAVANAAEHGNELDPSKRIRVEYILEGGTITVCVGQVGAGIHEADVQNASLPDDPFDTGGRGLYIIRELAEKVWLEDEGRRMCLLWAVPPSE